MAEFNLANMYRKGEGVTQQDAKAVLWYRKAADQGYAPAQNSLAYMYAQGRGAKKDEKAARELFQKAFDQGLGLAQRNLGVLKQHDGKYDLVSMSVDSEVRATMLTEEPLDLARWLDRQTVPGL